MKNSHKTPEHIRAAKRSRYRAAKGIPENAPLYSTMKGVKKGPRKGTGNVRGTIYMPETEWKRLKRLTKGGLSQGDVIASGLKLLDV